MAVAMRGSLQEVFDLLREFALKHEAVDLAQAVEHAALERPTMEVLSAQMEEVGFDYVDVERNAMVHEFQAGQAFFEDPIARLVVLPELRASLAKDDVEGPWLTCATPSTGTGAKGPSRSP
jgi:hypothetical protein